MYANDTAEPVMQNNLSLSFPFPATDPTPMEAFSTKTPLLLRPFLLCFFLSLSVVIFFTLFPSPAIPELAEQHSSANLVGNGLRIRPGYGSYESYIQRQLNKTLNPKLIEIWKTRDWDRKVRVFSLFFESLKSRGLISNSSKALSIGARVGQEVAALQRIGVSDAIGIDLVPSPPLVIRGDFHSQPFPNNTFDFEFSNVFDHALYPDRFVGEIERTLRPGGVCVLHVALSHRADKYSANDLFSLDPLVKLFEESDLVYVRKVDGFGLDTEVLFKKRPRET